MMFNNIEKNFSKFILYHLFILGFLFLTINCHSIGEIPLVKKLNNGKYIVVSSKSILFLDPSLINETNVLNISSFGNGDIRLIEQFSNEDDDYIIVMAQKDLYIFSQNENLLNKIENNSFINPDIKYAYYSIIPYNHIENDYYFYIIYINSQESYNFYSVKGTFNSLSNLITLSEPFNFLTDIYSYYFSCKLMEYNNQNIINCIYSFKKDYVYLNCTNFAPEENFKIIEDLPSFKLNEEFYSINGIKSLVLPGKKQEIFWAFSLNFYECYKYDILTNTILNQTKIESEFLPSYQYSLLLEYFSETDEILIGFSYFQNIYLSQCTIDLQCTDVQEIQYIEYSYRINPPNIVIPINKMNYYSLSYFKSYEYIICNNCINYLFLLKNLTFNSFNSNKTSVQCHDNCETCNEKPTEDNNNCLTCKDSLFFDLGNCISECSNGYFIDENNNNKICKCSDIKCKYCNSESLQYDLCISCNTELGFYPKKLVDKNQGTFVNCYNASTISNGYYLNLTTNQYELCYVNCKQCNELGDENDNKCISCISNYTLTIINETIQNCYPNCNYYYYFDENNIYTCTSDENCPENYKLINSTNKCIKNCLNDSVYKFYYEYNNVCFKTCPGTTYALNGTNLCVNSLTCNEDEYYNYDHTECIDNIPEGYYCNNTELKTIDKCHENCQTCEKGGTDENNNCITCIDSKYFDLGNCVSNCNYGFFIVNSIKICKCSKDTKCNICTEESLNKSLCITCNDISNYFPKIDDEIIYEGFIQCYSEPEGYYLKDEFYYPCNSNCKKCIEIDTNYTECSECMLGYILTRDLNNNTICFKECDYYYYYDLNNNSICTLDYKCPENFNKLIISKNECIDNCTKDDKYKYEYNNNCYEECPTGTYIVPFNLIIIYVKIF